MANNSVVLFIQGYILTLNLMIYSPNKRPNPKTTNPDFFFTKMSFQWAENLAKMCPNFDVRYGIEPNR